MKKFLSLFLVFVFTVCICASLPLTPVANALYENPFELNSGGKSYCVSSWFSDDSGILVIPSEYEGLPVTRIGEGAFSNCSLIEGIVIPDTVTSIGNYAFSGCTSLTSITIPESVIRIGEFAFSGCLSLSRVNIESIDAWCNIDFGISVGSVYETYTSNPLYYAYNLYLNDQLVTDLVISEGTKRISNIAFMNCTSITDLTISDTVTSIGDFAFSNCTSLSNITIGKGVTSIGDSAFNACSEKAAFIVNDNQYVCNYLEENNLNYILNRTNLLLFELNDNSESYCVTGYWEDISNEFVIPETYNDLPVTDIGCEAFENCDFITSVTIPDSVINIDDRAFYSCTSLESVTLGNNIESIGEEAFYGCVKLSSISIPQNTNQIGDNAFINCRSLELINVSANNENYASVDGVLFNKEKTMLIKYPQGKTLTQYIVPDTVTKIYDFAFQANESLVSVEIPNSITDISDYAFYGCSNLTSVSIPKSVIQIGENAFGSCVQLKKVNIADIEKWCNIDFYSATANPLSNGGGLYLDGKIIRNIILPETLIDVKKYTFSGNKFLKSVKLPDTIEKIGENAFDGCLNLELLVMSKNVTDIGDNAFAGCKKLESVVVPKSLKNVGYGAFHPNDGLKYVFYEGSPSDWNNIIMDEDNFTTKNLVIHYNSTDHTYIEVVNDPIFEGVEGTREEVCEICGHVGKEEKIEFLNEYLAGVTTFDVALNEPTQYLSTNISASKDLNESIVAMDGYTLTTTPNSEYGYYGTGSKVQVTDATGTQVAEYTLVVRGDVNGDSVCDGIDLMLIELARHTSNNVSLEGAYFAAANLAEDNEIDIDDFNAVVNKALI